MHVWPEDIDRGVYVARYKNGIVIEVWLITDTVVVAGETHLSLVILASSDPSRQGKKYNLPKQTFIGRYNSDNGDDTIPYTYRLSTNRPFTYLELDPTLGVLG